MVSTEDRPDYIVPLEGTQIWLNPRFVVSLDDSTTNEVRFWLDRPTSQAPNRTDTAAPFEYSEAGYVDITTLSAGSHTMTIMGDFNGQPFTQQASFIVYREPGT